MAAKSKPKARSARTRPAVRRPQPVAPAPVTNRVAVATAPALAVLARLPKLLMPALVAVGVIVGLALGGVAGLLCLSAVVALLGWLLAAFWPLIPAGGRVVRVLALLAVLAVGILQL